MLRKQPADASKAAHVAARKMRFPIIALPFSQPRSLAAPGKDRSDNRCPVFRQGQCFTAVAEG
jgi:hypothetical protein